MRQLLFFILVFVILGTAHWYVGRRLIPESMGVRARRVAWAAVAAIAGVPFLALIWGQLSMGASRGLAWAGFTVMGMSSLLVVFVGGVDGIRGVEALWRRARGVETVDHQRRAFLSRVVNMTVVGGSGGLTAMGYVEAVRLPRVVEVDLPVSGLAPGLEGFRIVQLTDLHVGPTIGRDYLSRVVELSNAQKPDLVAITGDLVDGFVDDLQGEVAPLRDLQARHGSFFVTGNHEYYWNGPAWCHEVARLGARVLTNEHVVVEHDGASLVVAGITDHRGGAAVGHASDPAAALAHAPAGLTRLMLAHQPRSAHDVVEAGADLMICGHTHGGQYFPMNILVHLFQPYVAGLHLLRETWIYVSRGAGYWGPPNRFGAPSEITVLKLRRAGSDRTRPDQTG